MEIGLVSVIIPSAYDGIISFLRFIVWLELIISVVLTILVYVKNKNRCVDLLATINWIKLIILLISKVNMGIFPTLIGYDGIYQRIGFIFLIVGIILFIIQIIIAIIYLKRKEKSSNVKNRKETYNNN